MQRDVAFIVEVKPWGPAMGEDFSTIVDIIYESRVSGPSTRSWEDGLA